MAAIRITDLIAALQDVVEEHGEDTLVAVATQPTYPLRVDITSYALSTDLEDEDDGAAAEDLADEDDFGPDVDEAAPVTVWLLTDAPGMYGGDSPYAPAGLWDVSQAIGSV